MSYNDLQKQAYATEEELKVLAVWLEAARKEIEVINLELNAVKNDLEDHEEDLKDCKSRDVVLLQEYIFLADCVECYKMKVQDLNVNLAKAKSKQEQLETKKPELEKAYSKLIKQMERYENNVLYLQEYNGIRSKKDVTRTT